MNKTKSIMAVMLVFIFGAASGALVTHVIHQARFESFANEGRPPREDHIVKRLTSKLDLNSQQQEKVRVIIHDTQASMQQIRRQSRPQIEGVLAEGQLRISALLTPEQREKFEKIIAEHKSRRHANDH
jgi:Spy/CpxP family protein refolding chaperone